MIFVNMVLSNYILAFVSFLGIVTFLVILYVRKVFNYWNDRNVLNDKPSFPLGSLGEVGKIHIAEAIQNIYNKYVEKDIFCGMYFTLSPRVLALDLDFMKNIMIKDFQYFQDRKVYFNEKVEPIGAHLFNIRGEKWRTLRSQLSPTFTSGKMKMMFELVEAQSENLRKYMDRHVGETVSIKDVSVRFTADVIGITAFGLECRALIDENAEILDMARKVFEFNTLPRRLIFLFQNTFQGLAEMLGSRIFTKEVADYFTNIIQNTVEYREKNNVNRKDFMNLLLEIKNHGKLMDDNSGQHLGTMTFNQLLAQAFIFFFAGFETSSTTMQFCLYEMANNEEIQEKARTEVRNILKKHDGRFTYDSIKEMEYLDHCIDEALRLWPPVHTLFRVCNKKYKVPNSHYVIEKDTQVMIPVYGIHRNPKLYPNPTKYDPDRFTHDNVRNRHPFAFLPFGDGPRNCIGLRFGLLQTKMGLATMLANYRFRVNPRTQQPLKLNGEDLFMTVKGGIWLDYEKLAC